MIPRDGAATDRRFMAMALALAARGLGRVWPNPAVGCVLVKDDRIVARGWTQPGGRPHAEAFALASAGNAARGAAAYVTLEPCSHHGRTPPCADALIDAGVARVVVATTDPDPRVDGRGLEKLRSAGIAVETGVMAAEAEALNRGFILNRTVGRPLVTLKLASSADGRIATVTGESQWITGPAARAHGHRLRATHDAILIGSGTALADDPALTCRLPGLADRSPVRVVLDRRLRLAPDTALAGTARDLPTTVLTAPSHDQERRRRLEDRGVEVRTYDGTPASALADLAAAGITRLLIEGGAGVAGAFLRAGLVDRIVWYRAGLVIGGDGRPAVEPIGALRLDEMPRWRRAELRRIGDDVMEVLEPAR